VQPQQVCPSAKKSIPQDISQKCNGTSSKGVYCIQKNVRPQSLTARWQSAIWAYENAAQTIPQIQALIARQENPLSILLGGDHGYRAELVEGKLGGVGTGPLIGLFILFLQQEVGYGEGS